MKRITLFLILTVLFNTVINAQSEIVATGNRDLKENSTNWTVGSISINKKISDKTIESYTSSNNILDQTNFHVYPNPFLDKITINSTSNEGTSIILLYDIHGKKLFSGRLNKKAELNFSKFSSGLYFLHINTKTYKLLKL